MTTNENVEDYLAKFSGETRAKLDQIRNLIAQTVPKESVEKISYGIPTFSYKGNPIHYGGFKNHVSIFPGSKPIEDLREELKDYKTSKGTVIFALDKPLPEKLIVRLTKLAIFRKG